MDTERYIILATRHIYEDIRDDVRQEIRIALWQKDIKHPKAYINTMARRFERSRLWTGQEKRSLGAGRKFMKEAEFTVRDDLADGNTMDFLIEFDSVISTLDFRDKKIARMRIVDGDTWGDIAADLGMSSSGVYNRWDRHVLPKLKEML